MPQLVILNLHFSQEMTSTPKFPGTDVSLEKSPNRRTYIFHPCHTAQIVATLYHPSMSIYLTHPVKHMLIFLYDSDGYKTSRLSTISVDAFVVI